MRKCVVRIILTASTLFLVCVRMKASGADVSRFKYSDDTKGADTSSTYSLQGILQSLMDAVFNLTRIATRHASTIYHAASDAGQLSRREAPPPIKCPTDKKNEFEGADTGNYFSEPS